VAVLQEGPRKAGLHRLRWDGRDDEGRLLASGVYMCRLVTEEGASTHKLMLLR
jgi:flagellar hook assembly protein FlgD